MDVQQTSDDGFLLAGWTQEYNAFLIKTDPEGNGVWQKTYGEGEQDWFNSVLEIEGGEILAVGFQGSFSLDTVRLFLVRTTSSGEVIWEKDFPDLDAAEGTYLLRSSDGNYVIAGGTRQNRAFLGKFAEDGTSIWGKSYQYRGSFYTSGKAAVETESGFILLGGTTPFFDSAGGILLVGTDKIGEKRWENAYGGTMDDLSPMIGRSKDGNLIIVSERGQRVYVAKATEGGSLFCDLTFDQGGGRSALESADGGIIVAGFVQTLRKKNDVLVIKLWPERPFLRGDLNDDAVVDLTDAIYLLGWLFLGGKPPSCADAADANDDCRIDISDASSILNFLFLGGGDLTPHPIPALDPTPDLAGCPSATA